MPVELTPNIHDLMTGPVCATFVTLLPDGGPHATVVWRLWEAPYILVSSLKDSQKARNITHDPRVALVITDPQNPYRYIQVRGVVVAIESDPDAAMIDRIALLYTGAPYYGGSEPLEDKGTVEHITFRIDPVKIIAPNA
ncbi:MAG: hypothetical protein OHK0046_42330 [Anaerolineae bacterium]